MTTYPRIPGHSTAAAVGAAISSSLSERSLSALFITLREGKSASVARSLASKRSPSALSLGKYVLSDKLLVSDEAPSRSSRWRPSG